MLPGMSSGNASGLSVGGVSVSFDDQTPYASDTSPSDVTAGYTIRSDGTDEGDHLNTWLLGGTNSDVEVRADIVTGTVTTGTTGAWLIPTTNLTWSKSRTSNIAGISDVALAFQCRRVSDLAIIDTWNVTITAEVE